MSRLFARPRAPRSRPGFSLIELLVVIGIVAVLFAIVFTVFHGVLKFVWSMKG